MNSIPRDNSNDYALGIIEKRQKHIKEFSGTNLEHINQYSINPETTRNNIENFIGVAQVPLGIAGPLNFIGEDATGEILIPLATTEGSLIASYNRGMKILNLSGGVKTTVVASRMQRAPVFGFEDTREARKFEQWITDNFKKIKRICDSTTKTGKLEFIEKYVAGRFVYLRLNFYTGDAAGQNMVTRATEAGCKWIQSKYKNLDGYYLESNFATDKKSSNVNILSTRGKRVSAECTFPKEILKEHLRITPYNIAHHYNIAGHAAFISGATSNGLQSANGITALFIATGQDVANVAESSAMIFHCEINSNDDLYINITIPSLIVGSYGGGTGLPTQNECLKIMDCVGTGKVTRLAEIVAGTVLAGEISLAAAISSNEWVGAHERFGRNK